MTPDRRLSCLSIFLFIALCASLFVNFVLMIAAFKRVSGIREAEPIPRFREILLQRGAGATTEKIAVITMRGLISSSIPGSVSDSMVDDLRAALQQARDDNRVKAIVLEIDSPGGEVTASDEIYNAVVKTRATKPVVVYMESLAASGGYYVSCGGRFLMANETTITGSIGVIIQTLNYEQLFNKIGLASVVFKSGKFKDILNGARPMTPEERDLIQRFVMETYDKFLGVVSKERSLPADMLRNNIADGRIISGKEAFRDKLVDGLGQLEDAFAKAKQLGNAPQATVVKYGPPFSLARIFRAFGEFGGESKLQLQRGVRDRDALGVDADRRSDIGDAAALDAGPVPAGVAGHRRIGERQDAHEVVAGEEETTAEGLGAGGVVQHRVPAERDVEGDTVTADGAAVASRAWRGPAKNVRSSGSVARNGADSVFVSERERFLSATRPNSTD